MSRRNWILAGLAGAALLAGTAVGAKAQAPAGAPPVPAAAPKPPAVVNGEVVSRTELDAAVKQVAGAQPSPVQLTDDQRRGQQMQVLSLIIDDKLMRQFLAKNIAAATQAEVTRADRVDRRRVGQAEKNASGLPEGKRPDRGGVPRRRGRGCAMGQLRPLQDQRRRGGEILQGQQGVLRPA